MIIYDIICNISDISLIMIYVYVYIYTWTCNGKKHENRNIFENSRFYFRIIIHMQTIITSHNVPCRDMIL